MKTYLYFTLILLFIPSVNKTFATDIEPDNGEIETYIEVPVNGSEDVEKLISLGLSIEANIIRIQSYDICEVNRSQNENGNIYKITINLVNE